ncbi:hypothetical protein T02_11934, partial [Trichinella nativa]
LLGVKRDSKDKLWNGIVDFLNAMLTISRQQTPHCHGLSSHGIRLSSYIHEGLTIAFGRFLSSREIEIVITI